MELFNKQDQEKDSLSPNTIWNDQTTIDDLFTLYRIALSLIYGYTSRKEAMTHINTLIQNQKIKIIKVRLVIFCGIIGITIISIVLPIRQKKSRTKNHQDLKL